MKCDACDVILTTAESVRKFKDSGTYVNLCNKCLSTISDSVTTVDGDVEDDDENEYND
ncbi:hypothetical protein UFOVP249_3 [uncultured Caudovirales phage]|uniref:Uncharacterized protein n=1 Tax=uncultured Caudovirales phage TaxID=2100421 RepID=A0A6J5LEY9_9CAUD|nr:hypothetical protein UFOVP249_3 [uncultured Caudovirales phage]